MSGLLFVDDEPLNLKLFKRRFDKYMPINIALSAEEALTILKEKRSINIIIADIKMPGKNGIELLKIIEQEYPLIKRYLITGLNETNEIKETIAGNLIEKCFYKPIDFQEIKNELFK